MLEVFYKLGVDWKLLLAQAVNFILLLFILRFTVYKPMLDLLRKRRQKIEKGERDADDAAKRLNEAEEVKRAKIREGEEESISLIKRVEEKSKNLEQELLRVAHKKEAEIVAKAEDRGERIVEAEREKFYGEATDLVRQAILKIAEVKKDVIDEHLVSETIKKIKEARAS